jgi:hypothetical protein
MFCCTPCKKYLDKKNHRNQRHYPFKESYIFIGNQAVQTLHLWLTLFFDNGSLPVLSIKTEKEPFYHHEMYFYDCRWMIFKKMKTLCDIEGEISNWTN